MPRSPNYNPATHGTGWPPNQPSNAIVAYLNNPVVTNQQRLMLWEQEGVTPPPNFSASTPTPTPTTTTSTTSSSTSSRTSTPRKRTKTKVKGKTTSEKKFIINWNRGLTEGFQKKIADTPKIYVGKGYPPSQPAGTSVAEIETPQITTTTRQTITNPIVENFQPLPPENTTGLFGIKDE